VQRALKEVKLASCEVDQASWVAQHVLCEAQQTPCEGRQTLYKVQQTSPEAHFLHVKPNNVYVKETGCT
jgi:hypothetical protein